MLVAIEPHDVFEAIAEYAKRKYGVDVDPNSPIQIANEVNAVPYYDPFGRVVGVDVQVNLRGIVFEAGAK